MKNKLMVIFFSMGLGIALNGSALAENNDPCSCEFALDACTSSGMSDCYIEYENCITVEVPTCEV